MNMNALVNVLAHYCFYSNSWSAEAGNAGALSLKAFLHLLIWFLSPKSEIDTFGRLRFGSSLPVD